MYSQVPIGTNLHKTTQVADDIILLQRLHDFTSTKIVILCA